MEDCLRKAISKKQDASLLVIDGTNLVQESMERLQAWPPAMIHLGQAMLGAHLLLAINQKQDSTKLKSNETLSITT